VIPGWGGASTNVVVRIDNNVTGRDEVTFYNAANSAVLPLGAVNLNRNGYVGGYTTFGASGTASTLTLSGGVATVQLGLNQRADVDPVDRHLVEVAVDLDPLEPAAPDHGALEVDVMEARLAEVDLLEPAVAEVRAQVVRHSLTLPPPADLGRGAMVVPASVAPTRPSTIAGMLAPRTLVAARSTRDDRFQPKPSRCSILGGTRS